MVEKSQILMVTGYSGAGKNTVLRALEDSGFYCVDNLPINLLHSFLQQIVIANIPASRVALGIDVRGMRNVADLVELVEAFRAQYCDTLKIFFLACSTDVLVKRFQETRRRHPLAQDIDLFAAIEQERQILKPLIEISDLLLDTEQLNIHELRNFTRQAFDGEAQKQIMVNIMSFGFKYGVPTESNFVYDVRSLPNPYFIPALKCLNGTQQEIQQYLFANHAVQDYWDRFFDFACYSIEKSLQEGRFFMNVAIGCTGGRHRSVAFAHKFASQTLHHVKFTVKHRDIDRDSY